MDGINKVGRPHRKQAYVRDWRKANPQELSLVRFVFFEWFLVLIVVNTLYVVNACRKIFTR